jgi:hypothetical protein
MSAPSRIFFDAMRELLHEGAIGSWRWLSRWRRADRAARELFIQAVLQGRGEQ